MNNVPTSLKRLELEEESISVAFLGHGLYCAAFQDVDNHERVFLLVEGKRDSSKKILAKAKSYRTNKHLPVMIDRGIQRIGYYGEFEVWETRYSESVDYKSGSNDHVTPEAETLSNIYPQSAKQVEEVVQSGTIKLSHSIVEALQDIERACESFGCAIGYHKGGKYVHYDLHNGNFGLDPETQTLILRDPITASF